MLNWAVEHNVAGFSELYCALAGKDRQRLVLQVTLLKSNVKLLAIAAMVDDLAEKVDECSLNQGVKYCLRTIGNAKAVRYVE